MHEVSSDLIIDLLRQRGVKLIDIADIVKNLQQQYYEDISIEYCLDNILKVLNKREVQHAILTGIELDILAEQGKLSQPLGNIILRDEPLYGIDEILVMSIVNVYGSIGFTNYGYLDKLKPGIIGQLDQHTTDKHRCHTFLDDLIGAIAAAAASRIAHRHGK